MNCTSPRTVGFKHDGKTISWSPQNYSKEYPTFQLPCGKCISCRLLYARQWAVRCMHEAQMHENNIFLTLTYSDEYLKSSKLIYKDFQDFMKRLRKTNPHLEIGMFVTGEYGGPPKLLPNGKMSKGYRPHWHAIIFNYQPTDGIHDDSNHRGDKIYTSKTLQELWPWGDANYGSVTLESAGYCARYAAKKLVHGKDQDHDYKPISKKSSKHAIGKKFLEKYWKSIFNLGKVIIIKPDGSCFETSIPRYYEKWLQKNEPEAWAVYNADVKLKRTKKASEKAEEERLQELTTNLQRTANHKPLQITKHKTREKIIAQKQKMLQEKLKL